MSGKSRTFAAVIELERHIEILLLSNDCVIVPDLGGFMAHHVDARYDQTDCMFVPPIRTLGFNPQLKMNDSLLVQSYIEAYDISYPEALRRIEREVEELRSHLETTGEYELNDIGVLRFNSEGKLEFEPCEAGILTPELYGLDSFEMKPLAKEEPAAIEKAGETGMPQEKAITIKMSWLGGAVAAAAAVIVFLMISTPVSNSNKMAEVQQSAFINFQTAPTAPSRSALPLGSSKNLPPKEEAIPAAEVTSEASPSEDMEEAEAGGFCIVMASQVSERNAKNFISLLEEKGYGEARILVSGAKNIRRVVYGTYESEAQAANTLRQLRKESRLFRDTWIMEIK